jgi:hypothetical protein
MKYRLYVVVEIETTHGLQLQTDTLEFEEEWLADKAHDNLIKQHETSPVTRYEVTKLY